VNVALLLEMAADAIGDRRAVGDMTYAELHAAAEKAASEIDGPHVVLDVNSPAIPVGLFGAAIAGVPFVPLNYRLTPPEIAERRKAVEEAAPGDDVAVLLFTSGTTGPPKAALLKHEHLSSYVLGTVEFLGADEDEAALVSVPPYHVAGVAAVLSSVYAGRRIVYLPQFSPEGWVEEALAEEITHAMVVPTMLGRILDVLEEQREELPKLRHLSYGGGRMPVAVVERAMELLPETGFVNAYGLTETSSTISVLTPDDHREAHRSDDPAVRARLGSVGKPLPTLEVEIRDGEVWVRGEQVSGEYLGRGSALTEDGWYRTNDAGRIDDDGYLYIEGRLDDVIVRGAENLSPGEIEDTLMEHPAVAEAAVVGVPSQEWGEAVAAAVVLADGKAVTEAELQDFVRERLRSARTPERIEFRAELPYNETGKLLRRVLKAELSG
jgi:acyl-CoA synthetase (AMP-forming)/AMP-acid ligase II